MGKVYPQKKGSIFEEVLKLLIPGTPLVHLVKRECFDKVGLFDENLRFAEDFDMWLRIAELYEFDFVDEVVARYYVSKHQITSDRERALDGFLKFMAKHEQTLSRHPGALAHQFKYVAQCYLTLHEYASARRYLARAIRADPEAAHLYPHLLVTFVVPCLYGALISDTRLVLKVNRYRNMFRRHVKEQGD